MKITLTENVKPSMTKIEDAKQFMKKIRECSQSDITDKSIMSLNESTTKKSDITHNHS